MRSVHEVLRLRHKLGRSLREIAAVVGISLSTVSTDLRRRAPDLKWFLPEFWFEFADMWPHQDTSTSSWPRSRSVNSPVAASGSSRGASHSTRACGMPSRQLSPGTLRGNPPLPMLRDYGPIGSPSPEDGGDADSMPTPRDA